MNEEMSQKIVIPKGILNPGETTVIEIPSHLHGTSVVIAKNKSLQYFPSHVANTSAYGGYGGRASERSGKVFRSEYQSGEQSQFPGTLPSASGGDANVRYMHRQYDNTTDASWEEACPDQDAGGAEYEYPYEAQTHEVRMKRPGSQQSRPPSSSSSGDSPVGNDSSSRRFTGEPTNDPYSEGYPSQGVAYERAYKRPDTGRSRSGRRNPDIKPAGFQQTASNYAADFPYASNEQGYGTSPEEPWNCEKSRSAENLSGPENLVLKQKMALLDQMEFVEQDLLLDDVRQYQRTRRRLMYDITNMTMSEYF